jgi:hypothetical protein
MADRTELQSRSCVKLVARAKRLTRRAIGADTATPWACSPVKS